MSISLAFTKIFIISRIFDKLVGLMISIQYSTYLIGLTNYIKKKSKLGSKLRIFKSLIRLRMYVYVIKLMIKLKLSNSNLSCDDFCLKNIFWYSIPIC